MIDVTGLRKSFDTVTALDGIVFEARDGEVTGLIGPNGAGKTTALRILYTVTKPDSGSARIDEFDTVLDRQEVQCWSGVLPGSRGLYPRLTAREHVRYYGRLHGKGGKALEPRINTLVEALGMGEFADRRAKGFSKGQVRKATLARAMVHEPKSLLLDEPTNGLDIASSRAVHELIRDLKSQSCCVLFCSHFMREIAAVSDRIVVLSTGKVVVEGTTEELTKKIGGSDLEEMFLSVTGSLEGW